MILAGLIIILFIGGVLAWCAERLGDRWPRTLALLAIAADLALALYVWSGAREPVSPFSPWLQDLLVPWIPRFGVSLHLAMDGISLIMVLLTLALGVISVTCSWREIRYRSGFFHCSLLWSLGGAVGVFLALDLFLFFFFWELMLVPMYFLISVWGHEDRTRAAIKFFLFTQGGGLLMLVSIVALALLHQRSTGELSFDYFALLGGSFQPTTAFWLMLGFFIAFAVKLPVVPLHTWLPDAHTEAPTAGSVVLAGILLKTGAYGLIRFVIPLFPHAALTFAPVAMGLGVLGILYGAILAFSQRDLKRMVAYTSISHLGFVLLGVFAWNTLALSGAIIQMVAHGLTTGALFVLVGMLQERMGTRELGRMGGLWATVPRLSALGLFLAIASLGMPGLANFVGEFLILLGAFRTNAALASVATAGLVLAAVYALALVQRAFHGENSHGWHLTDASAREVAVLAGTALLVVWLGMYPQPLLDTANAALLGLQQFVPL